MTLKLQTFSAPFTVDSLSPEGSFKGVAAVYDQVATAKEMDVLMSGSLTRTIDHWQQSGKRMPFLYQHDPEKVIGSLVPSESTRGMEVDGQFDLNTQLGKETHSLVKNQHITGLSIGFLDVPAKTERRKTARGIIRFMKEVKLFETSLVTFPADAGAQIETVHAQSMMDQYNPDGMGKEEWVAMKIKKLLGEGKSQADAVAEATGMWDEMTKGMHAITYISETLDIRIPETISHCITYLNQFLPDVSKTSTETEQHSKPSADPEQKATTQLKPETPAPGFTTATALQEYAEMLRAFRREA